LLPVIELQVTMVERFHPRRPVAYLMPFPGPGRDSAFSQWQRLAGVATRREWLYYAYQARSWQWNVAPRMMVKGPYAEVSTWLSTGRDF